MVATINLDYIVVLALWVGGYRWKVDSSLRFCFLRLILINLFNMNSTTRVDS